jgi:hypothetical protein
VGQRVAILFERTYRYLPLGRVYICDCGTWGSVTLPESFTDRGVPAVVQPLTADVLTELAAVVAALRPHLTDHDEGSNLVL